ncbi:MAG: GPW/gp25 family protein [Nitrososphaeraceae archaeon]
MQKKGLYRGYSSYNYQTNKSFVLENVELVKMDLLNHIYTRKGERVYLPNFGTRIPEIIFEPLDQITMDIIEEDLRTVFAFDPRVELLELNIIPLYDNNTIIASAKLLYIELSTVDDLDLNIVFEGD